MDPFERIYHRAVERKGAAAALDALLPKCKSADELAAVPDDRYLSAMTRCVFQAGFVWRVVEAKWPHFETAFDGFDPGRIALMDDAALDRLLADPGIIRNGQKIEATQRNANFVLEIAKQHGSLARFIADWPVDDIVGLWAALKTRASRLGGSSGPLFLRTMGKDTFMLSRDVVRVLVDQGVVDKAPTSKRGLEATQLAFNRWRSESGRPLCQISRIIACSVD